MPREAKRTVKKEEIVSLFDHTQENILYAVKVSPDAMLKIREDVKAFTKSGASGSEIIESLFKTAKEDDNYLLSIILYMYLGAR